MPTRGRRGRRSGEAPKAHSNDCLARPHHCGLFNRLLVAARHLADTLTDLQKLLSSNERYELPHDFAAFVATDLAQAKADGRWIGALEAT